MCSNAKVYIKIQLMAQVLTTCGFDLNM